MDSMTRSGPEGSFYGQALIGTRTSLGRGALIQDMLWIRNEDVLHSALSVISGQKNLAMKISTIDINLPTTPSTNVLNRLLKELPGVNTATICVPSAGEILSLEILHDIEFPCLQSFATSLHHGSLVGFLQRHPSITSLCLGICGSECCPILPTYCPSLSDISGPTSCVTTTIQRNPITSVSAKHHSVLDTLPRLYLSMRSSTENITQLQLDFPATDYQILRSIRLAAPQVVSLKLTEISNPKPKRGRRPWNQSYWSIDLSLLAYLKTFLLSTAEPLVHAPGDVIQELALIRAWANDPEDSHRQLDTIAVWYSRMRQGERLSWFRRRGWAWTRDRCYDSPTDDEF